MSVDEIVLLSDETPIVELDDLRPLIAKDPSVAAGLEDFRLVTHAFPKGSVVFPAESKTGA